MNNNFSKAEMQKDLEKLQEIAAEVPATGPGPGVGSGPQEPAPGPVVGDFQTIKHFMYPAFKLIWKGYGHLTKCKFDDEEIMASAQSTWEMFRDIPVVRKNAPLVGFSMVHLMLLSKPAVMKWENDEIKKSKTETEKK